MGIDIKLTDNSAAVLSNFKSACEKALEECGLTAEGYAKPLTPTRTGALKNSISHQVSDNTCYVGSNLEYAA